MILYSGRLQGQVAPGELLYQVPVGTKVKLEAFTIANITNDQTIPGVAPASPVGAWLAIIPAGGTPDGSHRFLPLYSLRAGDALSAIDYCRSTLDPGDQVWGFCDTVGALNAYLAGVVLTGSLASLLS